MMKYACFSGDAIISRQRMTRLVLLVFSLCILTLLAQEVCAADEIKPGETLELSRCIAIALKNHPSLLSATGSFDASRSRVYEARSGYYPQVSASSAYSRTHPGAVTGAGGTGKGAFDDYQGTVDLNQTLLDFGKTSTQVEVNSLSADASKADLEDVTSQVILGVRQAYYGILQAKQSREANAETVAQFEQHLEQARRFYEVGIRAKIDVTTAEVDLSQAKLNLLKAQNGERIARITLNNAMGVPDAPAYEVKEDLGYEDYPIDLETALKRGYELRPDYAAVKARREAGERSIDLAYTGYYPVLSGNALYGWTGQDFPLEKEWTFGASLSFPLFSGFLTRYQVEEARGNLEVLRGDEALVRQNVRFDVEQAFYNLNDTREGIVLAKLSVEQAKENRELAQGRYATGVGSTIEVTDALVTEINAKTSYINALYAYRLAIANLEKAMGVRQ
jgi:outer membrane protein